MVTVSLPRCDYGSKLKAFVAVGIKRQGLSAISFLAFGLLAAILGTALWVIGAVMFNLITELVGGVRVTVLEEEVVLGSSDE